MKKTMNHCSKNGPKTEKHKLLHCFILIFCACFQGSKPTWIPDRTFSGHCLLVLVHDLTCLDPGPFGESKQLIAQEENLLVPDN